MPTLGKQLEQALNGYAPRMQTQANRFGTTTLNVSDVLLDPAYDLINPETAVPATAIKRQNDVVLEFTNDVLVLQRDFVARAGGVRGDGEEQKGESEKESLPQEPRL